ncbi:T6SS effector amidase Tae4 family protein [Helicobacter sp. T3_23-1056]
MSEKKKILATNISRPQWESVKKAYDEINGVYGGNNNQAVFQKIFHTNESYNTCAIRLSYALNYGGMSIEKSLQNPQTKSAIDGDTRIGKDKMKYVMGAWDMGKFLDKLWGEKDKDKYFDLTKSRLDECIKWLKENENNGIIVMKSSSARIQADGLTGHTTLWYGDKQCLGDYKEVGVGDEIAELNFRAFFNNIDAVKIMFWKL